MFTVERISAAKLSYVLASSKHLWFSIVFLGVYILFQSFRVLESNVKGRKTETDSKLCNSINSPYPMHFRERYNRHRSNVPCAPWKYFFIFHITFKIWSFSVPANFSFLLYSSFFDFWHLLQPRGFEVGMFVLLGALGIMSENTLADIGELDKDRYVRKYTCKPGEIGQTYTN